jgi:hypothetical protein
VAWIKLTLKDGLPTWVNFDAYVEMLRSAGGDQTILFTGHCAGDGPEYYTTSVQETPEEIFKINQQAEDDYG